MSVNPRKRVLSAIQSDVERAEEDARVAQERLAKLQEERRKNEDFQRQEECKRALNDPALFAQLFEGADAPLPLSSMTLDKVKQVVRALTQWKDKAVQDALSARSVATRVAVKTEEHVDYDPYNDQPYKQYITTYSDGSSDVRYGGKL